MNGERVVNETSTEEPKKPVPEEVIAKGDEPSAEIDGVDTHEDY